MVTYDELLLLLSLIVSIIALVYNIKKRNSRPSDQTLAVIL